MTEENTLDQLTVKELREKVRDMGTVTGFSSMKKDELIALIKQSESESADSSKPAGEPKAESSIEAAAVVETGKKKEVSAKASSKKVKREKKEVTIQDLKKKMSLLKSTKEGLTARKDMQERERIRKRINRLRKGTRKLARVAKAK